MGLGLCLDMPFAMYLAFFFLAATLRVLGDFRPLFLLPFRCGAGTSSFLLYALCGFLELEHCCIAVDLPCTLHVVTLCSYCSGNTRPLSFYCAVVFSLSVRRSVRSTWNLVHPTRGQWVSFPFWPPLEPPWGLMLAHFSFL